MRRTEDVGAEEDGAAALVNEDDGRWERKEKDREGERWRKREAMSEGWAEGCPVP